MNTLSDVLWADADFEYVVLDYDSVILRIRESTGSIREIVCSGQIGMELPGFWDEAVIESGSINTNDSFLIRCVESIEKRFRSEVPDSGNMARNSKNWSVLAITFSDGLVLKIVAAEFRSKMIGNVS